jgi:natural product biosynthesis luciferase-like monooxygenase protein
LDIGIGFFSSDCERQFPFELFSNASILADAMGLASIWIPERHYHKFGGAFPCPAVAAGALAASTKHVAIRAGSVVSPLHDAIEVAEQWAMVHALSHGRAGIALATGWKCRDFVTRPDSYSRRKELIWTQIEEIVALWRGETVSRPGVDGATTRVSIHPIIDLPPPGIWVTTSGDQEIAKRAGAAGVGLYTHLVNQSIRALERTIQTYRAALPRSVPGNVALMLHTYIAESDEVARSDVREPLTTYLRQFLDLKSSSAGSDREADLRSRLEVGVHRYFSGHSLVGSHDTCKTVLRSLAAIGVDEAVCLIDFGLDDYRVMKSIEQIEHLRNFSLSK